jgi:hypothetical protein
METAARLARGEGRRENKNSTSKKKWTIFLPRVEKRMRLFTFSIMHLGWSIRLLLLRVQSRSEMIQRMLLSLLTIVRPYRYFRIN